MRLPAPTVHLLAGLNGAGKTTLARSLEAEIPAVRFSLDEWMLRLHGLSYGHPDYPDRAAACQNLIWDTARQVLRAGTDVVLDWNQWSAQRRARWRDRARETGSRVVLHHIRVPLDVAVAQAADRRDAGDDTAHVLTPDAITHLAGLFEEPHPDEGIEIRVVTRAGRA